MNTYCGITLLRSFTNSTRTLFTSYNFQPMQPAQTPIEDLRKDALKHYDELSLKACSFNSSIPQAINFYFDFLKKEEERKKRFWQWVKFMLLFFLASGIITFVVAYIKA